MELIQIENKAGKVKLNDIVHQPVIDKLLSEIEQIFGASACANGDYTGELTNFAENAVDTLDLEIHSPGGSVFEGYRVNAALNEMRSRGVYVTVTINSLAASMGSVIAMASDKIRIVPGGRMMIHDVQTGVRGDAKALSEAAKLVDEMSNEIADIYAARTGHKAEDIREKMKAETWMGAKEALAQGFVDEIHDPKAAKNSVDIVQTLGTSGNMSFLDRLTSPSNAEALEKISALEAIISSHDEAVAAFEAKLEVAENALAEVEVIRAENVKLTEQVSLIPDLEASIAMLTEQAKFTAEKVDTAAAAKLAAMGHQEPLDTADDITPQDRIKNLSGIAKVQAAFEAQSQSKN